ncbi:MAG: DEAD/DEAH box helicase [Dehalococcoidia bacterium]|nr:DEAD/DEAH box helicase [Dehalococcoidia bacterium]
MPDGFEGLGLGDEVLRAIEDLGYEEPSPIQAQAIPALLAGGDVIAQAQTGTGKTAAYSIPIVERVVAGDRTVQAAVIVPTRELAVQVAEAVHALGRVRGVTVVPLYGGQPYDRQLRALRGGVQVVVGTPGRVMDHIRRGTLELDTVRTLVLDEADEMLDMGFIEDIEFILDKVPAERQIGLFSATIPARIEDLAQSYLREPRRVTIQQETATAPQTRQFWYQVPYRAKLDVLTLILDFESPQSAIIFCRTKREVDALTEALEARGYKTAAIHGDISQGQREQQLRAFRDGRVELLVATDVAARGLDIPDVTHVINYDIPDDADAYVHRIGRTGRMGKKGEAVTLITPREMRLLRLIEQQTRTKMKPLRLPTVEDIVARRREAYLEALRTTIDARAGNTYADVFAALAPDYEAREIALAALYLADGGEVPARTDGTRPEAESDDDVRAAEAAPSEHGMVRLFLDAGRKRGVSPQELLREFSDQAGVAPTTVGSIDVYDRFAFVEVKPGSAKKLLAHPQLTLHGLPVNLKKATPKRP